jgi:hypothetical protein
MTVTSKHLFFTIIFLFLMYCCNDKHTNQAVSWEFLAFHCTIPDMLLANCIIKWLLTTCHLCASLHLSERGLHPNWCSYCTLCHQYWYWYWYTYKYTSCTPLSIVL